MGCWPRRTGFPLFHNHVAFDLASSLFRFGTRGHQRVVDSVRLEERPVRSPCIHSLFLSLVCAFGLLADLVRQRGKALLLVTHNRFIADACDWVHEMKDGRIISSHPRGPAITNV